MTDIETELCNKIIINGVFSFRRFLDELIYYLDRDQEPSRLRSITDIRGFTSILAFRSEKEFIQGAESEDEIKLSLADRDMLKIRCTLMLKRAIFAVALCDSLHVYADWNETHVNTFEYYNEDSEVFQIQPFNNIDEAKAVIRRAQDVGLLFTKL